MQRGRTLTVNLGEYGMSKQARVWLAGVVVFAFGLGLLLAGFGRAGDVDVKGDIIKIAKALEKNDKGIAKKNVEALAKGIDDVYDMMWLFKPRAKKGLGVGPKPGAVTPDGIELKLISLGRDSLGAATLNKEARAIEEMAYVAAAIAQVTIAKVPPKDEGKKKRKDWIEWSTDMHDTALKLAQAAKMKAAGDVKTLASKLNNACNSCHSVFRVE
jgi:soluble cytochrome b562